LTGRRQRKRMATPSPDRILSLDVIRGIAVMGIFSVNVVGMAMIEKAYFYPPAYGFEGLGDRIMWAANFILVDGKLRAMFSILFGASTLPVIERAEAAGREGWSAHFPRMLVLLLFGLAHFYLLWWGDILANYALVGMFAFMFRRFDAIPLLFIAVVVFAGYYGPAAYERLQALPQAELAALAEPPAWDPYHVTPEEIAQDAAAHASIPAHFRATVSDPNTALRPIGSLFSYGFETLGFMLLGMAGYKSGFLTGGWSRRAYAATATVLVTLSLGLFGFAAWLILRADFDPLVYVPWDQVYVAPMHSLSAIGYMALIMLIFPRRGIVASRFAAVGRAAFSNYI